MVVLHYTVITNEAKQCEARAVCSRGADPGRRTGPGDDNEANLMSCEGNFIIL